jgi:hypothetical protein
LAANVVDLCAGYLCSLDERSTFPQTTGAESERIFDLDLPEPGMGDQAFAAALTDVIATSRAQNGRFLDTFKDRESQLRRNSKRSAKFRNSQAHAFNAFESIGRIGV